MNGLSRLSIAMLAISERFFAFEEFPNVNRSRFPAGICEAAMKVNSKDLASYSASRTGKELEAMILDFPALKTVKEWEQIGTILILRFSPRIIKLIFHLFQVTYDSEAVRFLVKILVDEANRKQLYPEPGRFFWDFGKSGDFFSELKTRFYETSGELDDIFRTCHISRDTGLAFEIRRQCLEYAELPVLIKNANHLIDLIEKAPEQSLYQTITNYINQFDVLNTADEVNQAVLKRFGEPSSTRSWDGFSEDVKKKFSQWCFCHRLKLHSLIFPLKYEVLSRYYVKVMQSCELEEASALVIEFDKIVIVDLSDRPYSCFYHREDFEREMKKWTEFDIFPSFLKDEKGQISARDYIIEEKDDSCILLRYEGIDLLYIKELLDIKFGLAPEFRRAKLQ